MQCLIYVLCEDISSHLGRLDYASLSQQALMEMLIDGITNREKICGSQEEPKDISEWEGVETDDNGDVTKIRWDTANLYLKGTLAIDWLPPTVREFSVRQLGLHATINWTILPSSLVSLYISWIENADELYLCHLAENLEEFWIPENGLEGSMNLEKLPKSLVTFGAWKNCLTGTVNLTQLPSKMEILQIGENGLSGTINVTSLPEKMKGLGLQENDFCGTIDLGSLPEGLEYLRLNDNKFLAVENFNDPPETLRVFDISLNVDLDGVLEIDVDAFLNLKTFNVSNTNLQGTLFVDEENEVELEVEYSDVEIIEKE